MGLMKKAFGSFPSARAAQSRRAPARVKRLQFECLELREVFSTSTFTIVNHSTVDTAGQLAFQDNQVYITLYGQDYNTDGNYYYFDAHGSAALTSTAPIDTQGKRALPVFLLSDLDPVAGQAHTYTIDLPDQLPDGSANGIKSARMYFSMGGSPVLTVNPDGVGSVNAPVPDNSFIDFIEFSLNAPANPDGNLNIDTTNVDQFGMPITITVASSDPTPPNGVGTATTRDQVIALYKAFTSTPGDPYAVDIWPVSDPTYGPYRILNPSGVLSDLQPAINQLQSQTVLQLAISASDTVINVYSAGAFPDPTVTPFTIQIDQEKMQVYGASKLANGTTNWLVHRGFDSTVAVGHSSSTLVIMVNPVVSVSQTTIAVSSATNFPTTYPFYVLVDSEIMKVVSLKSVNLDKTVTWNVERAQFGTVAAPHLESALVYYNAVVNLGLNSYFNEAIDGLFMKYKDATTTKLLLDSNADGTNRTYEGYVTQDTTGRWVFRFNIQGTSSPNFDVYYPFFNDNAYFWQGYTPQLTPSDAPSWEAGADVSSMSPSAMVFGCNGVFADNKYRNDPDNPLTADQLTVLADLENQMVSALNRGMAKHGNTSAGWHDTSLYYQNNAEGQAWNRYAEFLHKNTVSIDGKNYGFAFDDQGGQASDIGVGSFTNATITLGPWSVGSGPEPPPPTPSRWSQRLFMSSTIFSSVPPTSSQATHSAAVDAAIVDSTNDDANAIVSGGAVGDASGQTGDDLPRNAVSMRGLISSRGR